ncbi:MAG TPA: SPOR domain-containing protein [Bryobacteraceae bacterium]|jgi:cell division septation protein DedD|nr:SPOR domain-containing protein [Bryobacteraceae bacterium]
MLRTSENETEILLGNKQLLGIFFVIAVLLGVAFTGGYMVGRGPGEKKAAAVSAPVGPATPSASSTGGETHSVEAASGSDAAASPSGKASEAQPTGAADQPVAIPVASKNGAAEDSEAPLGSPKRTAEEKKTKAEAAAPTDDTAAPLVPQPGQTFLQVAAVTRDEAEAVADVLHRKGFRAHAVPKPGNSKIYRVLIGPVRDAGDLSSTRDALRKRAGFREVIVQKY